MAQKKIEDRVALITGITGQDGSYLAEFLLEKGYKKVIGVRRRTSTFNTKRVEHIYKHPNFVMEWGNMTDASSLWKILSQYKPDEIYNLAAQSHVKVSFDVPEETLEVVGAGTLKLLNVMREVVPGARFYQASSSVTGDTPVLVRRNKTKIELINIENLVESNSNKTYYNELECLTVDRNTLKMKWAPVAYVFSHYSSNVYRVRGTGGFDINITGNHSAMILDHEGKLVEKKIDDVKVNDMLLSGMAYKEVFNKAERFYPSFDLSHFANSEKYISRSNNQINFITINDDISKLLGYYLAEGNVYIEPNKTYKTCFTFHIKEKAYTDNIKKIVKDNFGIKCFESENTKTNTRRIGFSSKQLSYFILENFHTGSKNKQIPGWVYTLPKSAFISMMQGYIGDAKISSNEIKYTSANKQMLESLLYVSKLNGLDGIFYERKAGAFDLAFSSKSKEEIWPNKNWKQSHKQSIGTLIEAKVFNNLAPKAIKRLNRYSKNISKNRIETELQNKTISLENYKTFNTVLQSDLHPIKITSIEKLNHKSIKVYDLHVPETQIFIGGNYPLVLHNSEMYGDNVEIPQNETTRMIPASPYACAKLYAHNLCRNYRESYKLHISSGILFNHETVAGFMPLFFKEGNSDQIDIKPIQEIVVNHTKRNGKAIEMSLEKYQETSIDNELYVWDKDGWTKVTYASGYPHKATNYSKAPKFVVAKNGAVFATDTHEHIMENGPDKTFKEIEVGDKISLVGKFPEITSLCSSMTPFEAYMVGYIVGDGSYNRPSTVKIYSKTKESLKEFADYWTSIGKPFTYHKGTSGFEPNKIVWQLHLKNAKDWTDKFIPDLYTEDKKKRIPKSILNNQQEIQFEFLKGYNAADGLKKNSCTYEFKNFKTNSATLALGLIYLIGRTTKQDFNVNVEESDKWGQDQFYYSINLLSNGDRSSKSALFKQQKALEEIQNGKSFRQIHRETKIGRKFIQIISRGHVPKGIHHLEIEKNTVKKKIEKSFYDGWFFDLETESSTFHCGVGMSHVHNSPRRGETFVTRKITQAAARIKLGKQNILELGNLNAKRDWGFAKDYVRGMWMMLQQDQPDDYVLATGETHTVKEFLEEVFAIAKLDVDKHVKINKRLFRPHEVPVLLGDYTKAKEKLGWEPEVKFKDLAKLMYEADFESELAL